MRLFGGRILFADVLQHETDFLAHQIGQDPGQPLRFDDERQTLQNERQEELQETVVAGFVLHAIQELESPLQEFVAIE